MNQVFNQERTGTGTHEWSDTIFNIQRGCSNGCLYCYARTGALKHGLISTPAQWLNEVINPKAVNKQWGKRNGVIMFPTTHDITPRNLSNVLTVLKKILVAGNSVLVVSKPRLECIKALCAELKQYKEQILFRFAIGSMDSQACSFWEPGAPDPQERLHALGWAFCQQPLAKIRGMESPG